MKQEPIERLAYTAAEAADLCGVPERTMRHWLATHKVAGRKVGKRWLVSRKALDQLLNDETTSIARFAWSGHRGG